MFFYYLFASGTCAATAAGLLYIYDKNKAETVFYNVTWSFITLCAHLEDFYDKTFNKKKKCNKKNDSFSDPDFEEFADTVAENHKISCSEKITFYDSKNDKYETCYKLPDRDDLEWGFVKKKIDNKCKCRIYDDISVRDASDEFVMIEDKPFLQVELEQNEKKKEIHEYLSYFYLKGNKLFDRKFLKWYLDYWYKIDLEENYTLNIIDHEINIIQIKPGQHIILEDKCNYSIKK